MRIPITTLRAPQKSIPPIPVAAMAAAPKRPTIATSIKLMSTRLRLDNITGKAKEKTSLEISLSCGKIYLKIIPEGLTHPDPLIQFPFYLDMPWFYCKQVQM